MIAHADSFPPAVHDGSASIWHLAQVLRWLQRRGQYRIAPEVLEVAERAMEVNIVREAQQLAPRLRDDLRDLVA
jgi:hypothetical protein